MTDAAEKIEETEAPKPARKQKRKYRRRAAARAPRAEPFKPPEEFAGMTAYDCCDSCLDGLAKANAAQQRLNELEMMHPRMPSRDRDNSATVMEGDAEYLARIPQIAEEWRRCSAAVLGSCYISNSRQCAHPNKSPIQAAMMRDPVALQRYQRAKRALKHQMIDLRGQ